MSDTNLELEKENDKKLLNEMYEKLGDSTTLNELQVYEDLLVKVRGFEDESAQDLMLLLTEEVGELAKEVRKASTKIKMDVTSSKMVNLEEELSDVFSYVLAIARFYDISLIDAFKSKEEKNMKRIWE